jgi:RNase P subunit RPR2
MDIKDEIYKLLAQRVFSYFDSNKLVDWAIMMMQNGYESESLIILAGLSSDTTEEREKYFWLAVEELNIDIDKNDRELIDFYALHIVESVLDHHMDPYNALSIMQDVVRETGYSRRYIQFYEVNEDIDYLKYGSRPIFNSDLSSDNTEEFIRKEFELFLEAENLQIDDEIREMSYCRKCKKISNPKLKPKFKLFGPRNIQVWICGHCGSEKIDPFRGRAGKEIIINEIKKQQNRKCSKQ